MQYLPHKILVMPVIITLTKNKSFYRTKSSFRVLSEETTAALLLTLALICILLLLSALARDTVPDAGAKGTYALA